MKSILVIAFLFFLILSYGQNHTPIEITPQILKKINLEVENEITKLKEKISKQDLSIDEIEFTIDTSRIGRITTKRIDIDYSTIGMNISIIEMTNSYDKLLNKYYNKLLKTLNPEDKKILITAQKSWLVYRDNEKKLIFTMTNDEYSGGGTIQSNIAISSYGNLVVDRTIDIFNYYKNIIKDK